MSRRAPRVALTGGLATGKSHCLAKFAELGAATIDADAVARLVVQPGTPGFAAILRRFGQVVVDPRGSLDRARLAAIVFADEQARRDLEAIVHPAVYREIQAWSDRLGARIGIADIPLLYETGRAGDFDRVIVAACRPEQQLERAMARGLSREAAARRLAAQWPIEKKKQLADDVIDTSGTYDETEAQIRRIWKTLAGAAKARS